ncbi:FANCONI ANEMIA GROUP F PROTEIN FANCF [Salix purpurea]|uniref:FANCONI ANEMIA GROUP F PROTEIN FANCF n=1 Tax=Salix purpurea TaxID=77065 RepID=A0A9Q0P3B7_SALPP|nr:FANCONI ANEMIA GROUP F PROTEIN FANCF [Salix purpurea]
MGWNYPYISLEEMVKLMKGFVDIILLASGYQSSALLAHWDAQNIKKAFHWGSFFQNVLKHMSSSDVYQESIKELDAALCQMKSNPYFPQGLANLSCDTLSRARSFVLAHLLQTLPLRDSHLKAFLTAVIKMELEMISESNHDCLSVYLNKLKPQNPQLDLVLERRGFVKDSMVLSEEISQTVRCSSGTESDSSFLEEQLKLDGAPSSVGEIEQLADFVTWNHWKSKMVSYFLDKRTIGLVSGASMMFSAPKMQWLQVLERLNTSADCNDDGSSEIVELLLLGCIASKWNCLIEYTTSISYLSATISKLYYEVCMLIGRAQGFHSSERATNSKVLYILEFE